ncbi:MAG: hypothetical protein ACFFCZ_12840 [Promethearchaeota archaeon]
MSENFQITIDELEKKLRDATQQINESDQQNKQLSEELNALRNQINTLKSGNAEKDQQLSTLAKLYQEKTTEAQTKDGTISQLEIKITNLESKITDATNKIQEYEQKIRVLEGEKAQLNQNLMQITEGRGEEVASMRTELGNVQQQYQEAKTQFETKQIELTQTKNNLAQIQKELTETTNSLTQTQEELSQKNNELELKIKEMEQSVYKINSLENRIKEYLLSVKKLVLEGALDKYPTIRKDLMSHAKEVKVLELLMSNDLILSEQEVYAKIPDVSKEVVSQFIDQLKEEALIIDLNGYLALHKLLEDMHISEEEYKRADLGRIFNWAIIEAVSASSTEERQGALLKLHKILEERVQSPILFEMLVFTTKDLPDPNETVNALKSWKKRILESSLRR